MGGHEISDFGVRQDLIKRRLLLLLLLEGARDSTGLSLLCVDVGYKQ